MAISMDTGATDPETDAIWILSSTFIVFTMQSGRVLNKGAFFIFI